MRKYRTKRRQIEKRKWLLLLFVTLTGIVSLSVAYIANITPIMAQDTYTPYKAIRTQELTPQERIKIVAESREFKDIDNLLMVINCESRFDEYAIGNNGTSVDRGIAQFNSKWRPDVSNECAFNLECAVNEMISTVNIRGGYDRWTCGRILGLN